MVSQPWGCNSTWDLLRCEGGFGVDIYDVILCTENLIYRIDSNDEISQNIKLSLDSSQFEASFEPISHQNGNVPNHSGLYSLDTGSMLSSAKIHWSNNPNSTCDISVCCLVFSAFAFLLTETLKIRTKNLIRLTNFMWSYTNIIHLIHY